MIKLSLNGVPHKEFYSVYNAIEYVQNNINFDIPTVSYWNDEKMVTICTDDSFTIEVEKPKQMETIVKWYDSFAFHKKEEKNV